MPATITETLADWSWQLAFDDLPENVVEELEWHALDTVGVLLGATSMPYAQGLAQTAIAARSAGQATLIGDGRRTTAREAAFVNGCLGHGIDWDDTHLEALLHPTATILPPVLAVAEAKGLNGRDVLVGLAVGVEATVRMGLAAGHGLVRRGLHPTSMCGTFGVALAVARMFNLDRDATVQALGIAGGMCAGLHESVIDGSMNKCIHSGVAVQAGFAAAELARIGFTGPATIIEGPKGFLNAFVGEGGFDAAAITNDLGEDWHAGRLAYKAYACCQGAHPYADTALALFEKKGVRASEVASVTVRVGQKVGQTLCEPEDIKRRPPSAYAAKFSIPFIVATALTDGKVVLDSFTNQSVADADKLSLAARVYHEIDPYYDVGMALRGYVAVDMTDGRRVVAMTDACTGTPENPWTRDGIIAKFTLLAEPIIGANSVAALIRAISHLRSLPDMSAIVSYLSPSLHEGGDDVRR